MTHKPNAPDFKQMDEETLMRLMIEECERNDADGEACMLELEPLSRGLQLIGLLQLAMTHPALPASLQASARELIDGAAAAFRYGDMPACEEVIRRGFEERTLYTTTQVQRQ